jgi:hypothetical protein
MKYLQTFNESSADKDVKRKIKEKKREIEKLKIQYQGIDKSKVSAHRTVFKSKLSKLEQELKELNKTNEGFKLFEGFDGEDVYDEIDNWLDANSDYISASSLEYKMKDLLDSEDIEVTETEEEDTGGKKYGENWNTTVLCVKYKGKDLMKVCMTSDGRYASGMSNNMFGERFFFDKSLL